MAQNDAERNKKQKTSLGRSAYWLLTFSAKKWGSSWGRRVSFMFALTEEVEAHAGILLLLLLLGLGGLGSRAAGSSSRGSSTTATAAACGRTKTFGGRGIAFGEHKSLQVRRGQLESL